MATDLFLDVETSYDGELPVSQDSIRHRVATINREVIDQIRSFSGGGSGTYSFTANIFSDARLNLDVSFDRSGPGYEVFTGQVRGVRDSRVTLTNDGTTITLNIFAIEHEFQVFPLEETIYLAEEVNLLPSNDCDTKSSSDEGGNNEQDDAGGPDDVTGSNTIVKVLILYTSSVRVKLNGPIGTSRYITQMVENLNTSLKDSNTGTQITFEAKEANLSGMPSGYCDTVDFLRDCNQVKIWRRETAADLVSILKTDDGRSCAHCLGRLSGRSTSAFSAVNLKHAKGNHSFSHEIGHNFGCGHDFEASGCAERSARGRRFQAGGKERGTLLAYGANRINLFSGLDVYFEGVRTGTPDRNNAATIRKTAPKVAAYHERVDSVETEA
jgi:hypothetical protein